MIPLAGLMPGPQELIIILIIVLLLFGGSRLAGLGKSTGRAIKEFKEETKGLKGADPTPEGARSLDGDAHQKQAELPVVQPPLGTPSQGSFSPQGAPHGQQPHNTSPYGQHPPQDRNEYSQSPQDSTGTPGGAHDIRRDV